MRESVQGWRLKWFYIKDSSVAKMRLLKFVDVLEAVPKKSWKNILSPEENHAVDRLFDKILRIKESDRQTMMGTEIAVVFLKR
jgi:wyosine [tRNA(Phe)-imidazoG37] synthetase (radical SAM superfamily)